MLTETDALDQTMTRTYDGVGNMLTETDRRGARCFESGFDAAEARCER
ncbi:MAG: hypothetical protein M3Q07_22960 [Pseudobdellovibrionaceae bacterium]|nr:hypothetical protein [Pseudobdellovibrionaceae bacterium]